MRRAHRIVLAVVVLAAFAAPEPGRAAASELELVVIVNARNPENLSGEALEKIFLRKDLTWDGGERIIPLNASPDSERRQLFDRVVLAMSPDDAARYWLDQRIRGGGTAPREVADAVLTVKLVAKLTSAIGYVPATSDLGGVRVVARIRKDKVMSP